MLLAVPEWPVLPIAHLLLLAESLLHDSLTDLGERESSSLLEVWVHLLVEGLGIHEPGDGVHEVEVGTELAEHSQVSGEAEADYHG